ncbi:hypothetical protein A2U01_0086279, partial [Trifolium medium]|nr:hypothetical protein [Trifolium medium]
HIWCGRLSCCLGLLLRAGTFADGSEPFSCFLETSPRRFYVPVKSSNLPFVRVVLHFEMGSGRHREQICNGCPAEDALI